MAVTLTATPAPTPIKEGGRSDEVQILRGQLVVEIPDRHERWTLWFRTGRYDARSRVADTRDSACQVERRGAVVTVFAAPRIIVDFTEHTMRMTDGVTIIGVQARLRMRVPQLKWNWRTDRLKGGGTVRLDGERVWGVADGFTGDTALQRLHLANPRLQWRSKPSSDTAKE
jgi:hypothetical protein